MKRSSPLRKTELRRTGRIKKRSRINPKSKRKIKQERKWGPKRREYLKEFPICHVCNKEAATGVHEVLDGQWRDAAYEEPACWLSTCWTCNCGCLKSRTEWPWERQFARKYQRDRERFDLAAIHRILGNQAGSVTWLGIQEWLFR